ncbi:hypothetical protein AB1J88_03185 [Pseudomonas sp. S8]|uniref:hypothetical protein n=1 Tax=Pseudomonas sp. S8 TaxID=211136 RepID=UPI003D27D6E6
MKRSDLVLFSVIGIGLFMAGVAWRPAFGDFLKLKDWLECVSFLATTIAAMIAIFTLRDWRNQFRHAERFSALKSVKDAITDLHLYRGYLLAIAEILKYQQANDGADDPDLISKVEKKRVELLSALSVYQKAWDTAVAFITSEEEENFPGPPYVYLQLFQIRPLEIQDAHERLMIKGQANEFEKVFNACNEEAKEKFTKTMEAIKSMLRSKI